MNRRFATLALILLALTAASPRKAAKPAKPVPTAPLRDAERVVLTTDMGPITVEVDVKRAAVTAANFVRYAEQKRFDGTVFYRVMRLPWGTPPNGLIQSGTRGDPKRVLPPIAHETTLATGIKHLAGTISMARFAPGTANGDFSILLSDMPGLDADANPADAAGFAAFGRVVEGMDTVRRIYDAPLSATLGEGILKGQMIEAPVRIVTARRLP